MARTLAAIAALLVVLYLALAALSRVAPSGPTGPAYTASPARGASTTAAGPSPRARTITFTEQQLTDAARQYTPLTVSGITVTDPVVRLEPGRLILTATGRVFIFTAPIVVRASPQITGGRPAAKVESATFAGRDLPESTQQEIADTFARTLAANIPAGVRVTAMTAGSGSLTVETSPL
jgi:hypothetical protein